VCEREIGGRRSRKIENDSEREAINGIDTERGVRRRERERIIEEQGREIT